MRYTTAGKAVCNLSVATTRTWEGADGNKSETTDWHKVIVWGKQAENCAEYLKKGRQVYVEGRIEYRKWSDRDGNPKISAEIQVGTILFIGAKGTEAIADEDVGEEPKRTRTKKVAESKVDDDDIPF